MKKLFSNGKFSGKKVLEFLDKKGFYVVLVLCIVIVGATAVFVATRNVTSTNEDLESENIIVEDFDDSELIAVDEDAAEMQDASEEASIGTSISISEEDLQTSQEEAGQNGENMAAAKESEGDADKPSNEKPKPQGQDKPEEKQTEAPASVKLAMPVAGEIIFDYAMDRLVYSKTLEDWRTHSGVDIAAPRGTVVVAAADGFVSEVKNDPRFGATVILKHENGLSTVYSNLASTDVVTPNQKVKQGDAIGAVGNTALFESAEQPHLHFEVLKENIPVNPKEYLGIK